MNHTKAVVLFAHGSRDPNWRLPFEAILAQVKAQYSGLATLTFLENMQPSLQQGVAEMVAAGAQTIQIVPLFLAVGSHLKHDMPELIEQTRQSHPGIKITACETVGENTAIQAAIAHFAIQQAKI